MLSLLGMPSFIITVGITSISLRQPGQHILAATRSQTPASVHSTEGFSCAAGHRALCYCADFLCDYT